MINIFEIIPKMLRESDGNNGICTHTKSSDLKCESERLKVKLNQDYFDRARHAPCIDHDKTKNELAAKARLQLWKEQR